MLHERTHPEHRGRGVAPRSPLGLVDWTGVEARRVGITTACVANAACIAARIAVRVDSDIERPRVERRITDTSVRPHASIVGAA